MTNIPPEIWFHIAKFIPNEDLRDLLGVNSVFFNIAMDIRYRELVVGTTDKDIKTLKRISDPLVASRVYRLSVRLIHVKFCNSFSAFNYRHPKSFNQAFGSSKSSKSQPMVPTKMAPTDLIDEILNITDKLVNVRELFIELWNFPLDDLQPLISSFWSSFGPKLYTLSLSGILGDIRTLINSNPILGRLRDLRVEFSHSYIGTEASRAILVDVLLPFINNLAPQLLSLKLFSWAPLDLSTFFSQLAPFPGLKALNVRTPSSGLDHLICDSSDTLQRVYLRLNPSELKLDPSSDKSFGWLLECISDGRFVSRLQVLDIYPLDMTAGMDFLLRCIQRTSTNLVELIVRYRYLEDQEVMTIIDAASSCHNLTYLKMNIRRLDVGVTDSLALKLPRINRLWLSIGERDSNYLTDTFVQDLSSRSYTNWKLEDITIRQNGQEADSDVMLAFARSIPSLTSFFSSGQMQL